MKKLIVSALVVAMGLSVLSGIVLAGEEGAKKKGNAPVIGKVEVVKDGDNITEIKIVGKKESVSVVLDEKGKELAAMEGKEVMVKGEKGEDGKLTVSEAKEKPAKGEKKAKEEKKEAAE